MAAKILPFPGNNHEQRLNNEDSQLILERAQEIEVAFTALRNATWRENPDEILKSDGLIKNEQIKPSVAAASNVINMAAYQERKQLESIESEKTEAERRAEQARWEAERARRSA
jgi:hypothetical protein